MFCSFLVVDVGKVAYIGSTPRPVAVTTRMIALLVRNPYNKPLFATFTGWGLIWICLKDVSNDFCLMGFGPRFLERKVV